MIEAAKVLTAQLSGRWHGRYGMACCPAHNDRRPSLMITPGDKAVLFRCYAGCETSEILRALKAARLNPSSSKDSLPLTQTSDRRDEREAARRRWRESQYVRGTSAQKYLEYRGISEWSGFGRFLPSAITFENDKKITLPALILPISNGGGIIAIQRIFLDSVTGRKADIESPKKILGVAGDGAIRLGEISDGRLNLAEGFEDAASAMKLLNLANCWAVCGIERYQFVSIPDCIHSLTIYSQHGKEAARALAKAMPHLTANNRTVEIIMPPPGQDWNDCLIAKSAFAS